MRRLSRAPDPVEGAGLGLRRALMGPLAADPPEDVAFLEVAPENWMGVGGRLGRELRRFTERYPMVAHGLTLSLGGPHPLDEGFLHGVKDFLDHHGFTLFSEHLSFTSDDGQLYDLLPIPFTGEAVTYVAARIRRTQEILERRIAVENVSYYAAPGQELTEIEFLNEVLSEADCDLLLDVNNVYVNSVNHGYDPGEFMDRLPPERVAYIHVAGHYVEAPDLLVDTHGMPVSDPVWELLDGAYRRFGVPPTLLERDTNIPELSELAEEVSAIARLQERHQAARPEVATSG